MNDKEIIRSVMKEAKWTFNMISEALGYSSPSSVQNRLLNSRSMGVDTFVSILETMGYEVTIKSKNRDIKEVYKLDKDSFKKEN